VSFVIEAMPDIRAAIASTYADSSPVRGGEIGFLAVFSDEVVLFAGKQGVFKPKPTEEVVLSQTRSEVSGAALEGRAGKALLTLTLADGEE
jgi:hypothetical protein